MLVQFFFFFLKQITVFLWQEEEVFKWFLMKSGI